MNTTELTELEAKIFELIRDFPERIDEMETRREDACGRLARRIRELIEEEMSSEERILPL